MKWNYAAALSKMEKGDSFFIPSMEGEELVKEVFEIAKRIKIKVQTKFVYNYGLMGVRVWRIE